MFSSGKGFVDNEMMIMMMAMVMFTDLKFVFFRNKQKRRWRERETRNVFAKEVLTIIIIIIPFLKISGIRPKFL